MLKIGYALGHSSMTKLLIHFWIYSDILIMFSKKVEMPTFLEAGKIEIWRGNFVGMAYQ